MLSATTAEAQPRYTGIGSRRAPADILALFTAVAARLESEGWVMRSGGADGCDTAFEAGVSRVSNKEIYLPWASFNGRSGLLPPPEQWHAAEPLASKIHPAWRFLKPSVRKLHTRNVFQVLGADLTSASRFVLCWTPDGAQTEDERSRDTGGTGTAIALASRRGIPVFNAARTDVRQRLEQWIDRHACGTKDPADALPTADPIGSRPSDCARLA